MDLDLSDDQRLFAETARRFLASESSVAHARALAGSGSSYNVAVWRRGCALGWTSMLVPEELGGGSVSGQGLVDLALVAEQMGRVVAPGPLQSTSVVLQALARARGHDDAVARLLDGTQTAAWAFDGSSDAWTPESVTPTAERRGEDWVLRGTAAFVPDAPSADLFLVTASAPTGLAQFLVAAATAGLEVRPRSSLDLVRQVGDVVLDAVVVPASAAVGVVGAAAEQVQRQLLTALVLQNAETVGALERVYAMTLEHAGNRTTFGRPLASYQALKHRLADLKLWLEACLATSAASARAVSTDAPDAAELVSVAASYLAAKAPLMVQDCIQLHGGIGVTWEHDLHLYLRRITQNAALYGGVRQHRERLAVLVGM